MKERPVRALPDTPLPAGVSALDQERKAAMVGSLLVPLCGDHAADPAINPGSLY